MTYAFHLSLLVKLNILRNTSSLNPFKMVKLAKRLKKEKVNVDVINFGEEVTGTLLLITLKSFRFSCFDFSLSLFYSICSGGEHRETNCFREHSEWKGGHRFSSGHGAPWAQPGWCPAVFSHPGWWGWYHDGPGCKRLWVWSGPQCGPRTGPGKIQIHLLYNCTEEWIHSITGEMCLLFKGETSYTYVYYAETPMRKTFIG